MTVASLPADFGSAFRPACFHLAQVGAPTGIDIDIMPADSSTPLGSKRIYADDTAQINVAPYARGLLAPEPLCERGAGIYASKNRNAQCFLSWEGGSSPMATLCGGTEDAPVCELLSAAPATVKIAPGERDEMSIASTDWVAAVVTFRRGTIIHTDTSMGQRLAGGMVAAVVDVDAVARSYAAKTGAPADELDEFTVRLVLSQMGHQDAIVQRRYVVDRSGSRTAKRLAWVNRYGGIDYHTFPSAAEFRSSGARSRISTGEGFRTVATAASWSLKLLSEPCTAREAEWLSEIFSSPAVWVVDGGEAERVEVAAGEVVCVPSRPTIVEVVISAAERAASRGE